MASLSANVVRIRYSTHACDNELILITRLEYGKERLPYLHSYDRRFQCQKEHHLQLL